MRDIEELKKRLRLLREKFGLTQQQVAALAGLDYKFYQYIESPRKKQIWLETIARMADVYRMEVWQILHPDFLEHAKRPKVNLPSGQRC